MGQIFPGLTWAGYSQPGLCPGLKRTRLDIERVYYGLGQNINRVDINGVFIYEHGVFIILTLSDIRDGTHRMVLLIDAYAFWIVWIGARASLYHV